MFRNLVDSPSLPQYFSLRLKALGLDLSMEEPTYLVRPVRTSPQKLAEMSHFGPPVHQGPGAHFPPLGKLLSEPALLTKSKNRIGLSFTLVLNVLSRRRP